MRKIISIVLAIALLAGSIIIAKFLINNKKKPTQRTEKIIKTVFTQEVQNKAIPLVITANFTGCECLQISELFGASLLRFFSVFIPAR